MSWNATVLTDPADGIGPSIILTVQGTGQQKSFPAEYLIRVPEGLSRLALEHRVRPSGALRAVLLPAAQPDAAGGVPGLLLRLSRDGHEEVEIIGPAGTLATVHSLRHSFGWRFPRVLVSESDGTASLVYRDERVEVAAASLQRAWRDVPAWLVQDQTTTTTTPGSSSSPSTTSTSSSDEGDRSDAPTSAAPSHEAATGHTRAQAADDATPAAQGDGTVNGTAVAASNACCPWSDGATMGLPIAEMSEKADFVRARGDNVVLYHGEERARSDYVAPRQHVRGGRGRGALADAPPRLGVIFVHVRRARETLAFVDDPAVLSSSAPHPEIVRVLRRCTAVFVLCNSALSGPGIFAPAAVIRPGNLGGPQVPGLRASLRLWQRLRVLAPDVLAAGDRQSPVVCPFGDREGHRRIVDAAIEEFARQGAEQDNGDAAGAQDEGRRWDVADGAAAEAWTALDTADVVHAPLLSRIRRSDATESASAAAHLEMDSSRAIGGARLEAAWESMLRTAVRDGNDQPQCLARRIKDTAARMASLLASVDDLPQRAKSTTGPPTAKRRRVANEEEIAIATSSQSEEGANDGSHCAATAESGRVADGNELARHDIAACELAVSVPECLRSGRARDVEVMFLGTGSAEPSRYRGPSAVLLRQPGGASVLMDCGEGTWGQLVRWFGEEGARREAEKISLIWISHKHADHMLGVTGLLAHAKNAVVVGPKQCCAWLAQAVPAQGLLRSARNNNHKTSTWVHFDQAAAQAQVPSSPVGRSLAHAGVARMLQVPVAHCHDAHALVLEHNDGWKLVYSGDTQPCARLAAAASGATLLIHEATFEPDLVDQARKKRHSTSAEALETSRASGAFRTVLTHFSQRYPGVPGGLPTTGGLHEVPIVAFDGTRVRFGDLPALPLTTPLIAAALDSTAAREKAVDGVEA